MMRHAIMAAAAALVLATACKEPGPAPESAAFRSLPAEGWVYGDELEFVPVPEPEKTHGDARVAVAVRHTNGYLYSNLWLELSTPLAGYPDSMRVDTVNIPLADVYGKWYGRGLGVTFVTTDTLPGLYHYDIDRPARLRHVMRVDTVADLEQIGLIYIM